MVYLRKLGKLVFPSLMVALFILGSSLPVHAQKTCTIEVREQITTVTVSNNFQIDIWITDITGDQAAMYSFEFTVTWDDTQMIDKAITHHVTDTPGWSVTTTFGTDNSYHLAAAGPGTTIAKSWLTITFHCINAGSSPINIINVDIEDVDNQDFEVTVVKGAVTQNPRPPPSYQPSWVGGELTSVNKLAVLAPYLAIIGVVAAITAVYVLKRRREA